ncbi:MAG: ATPase, T2SS/T4P/T4SS family, partial [Bowdeniella nasicola]|nr:ATPase, T2SS/T4P/T4SS family [Bowdeniella nasicola]
MCSAQMFETHVRKLVAEREIDPNHDEGAMNQILDEAVIAYEREVLSGRANGDRDIEALRKAAYDAVVGFGPLQPLLEDPSIEEVWINGPDAVFIARNGISELTTVLLSASQIRDLVERMLRLAGRRLDLSEPFVDARLPGGERLHVVINPITAGVWAVNIRKFITRATCIADMVRVRSLTAKAGEFLAASVRAGINIIVSGRTQA